MSEKQSPQPGDIIVHKRVEASVAYALSGADGIMQVGHAAYDEAVQRACAFARTANVDVWFTEDERNFVLLQCHRDVSGTSGVQTT